jgi:catechol 2,3-dioxygenase-like lactoylglutathione lyase family enzyme
MNGQHSIASLTNDPRADKSSFDFSALALCCILSFTRLPIIYMFDHIGLRVSNFAQSKAFYEKALAPLESKPLFGEDGAYFGFGKDRPRFWISQSDEERPASRGLHVAFACSTRALVDAFYAAALAAGGKDNGKPGLRPEYHEHYYGAFVLDPDGNNIEAVCHLPA